MQKDKKVTTDIKPFPREKKDIKLIVCDLDGTLLNTEHVMSDANREALKKAQAEGVQVVIATGKTRYGAESVIAALDLKTPGIFVQGLIIANPDGKTRYQTTLDPIVARKIITSVEQRGLTVIAYSGNRLLVKSSGTMADQIAEYGEPMPEAVGPLVNILSTTPINKLVVIGDVKKVKSVRWQLSKQVGEDVSFTSANIKQTLEILPFGASKGKSMLALLREMQINPDQVMAIGDGENDLDMIRFAGVGVAVGNAFEGLKEIADEVVASNDDDGVAEAINRFVLGDSTVEDDKANEDDADTEEKSTDDAPKDEEADDKKDDAPNDDDSDSDSDEAGADDDAKPADDAETQGE